MQEEAKRFLGKDERWDLRLRMIGLAPVCIPAHPQLSAVVDAPNASFQNGVTKF